MHNDYESDISYWMAGAKQDGRKLILFFSTNLNHKPMKNMIVVMLIAMIAMACEKKNESYINDVQFRNNSVSDTVIMQVSSYEAIILLPGEIVIRTEPEWIGQELYISKYHGKFHDIVEMRITQQINEWGQ